MTSAGKIIVFDGVCVLCSRGVRFVLARDKAKRFRFAAMQSASGRDLLRRHGLDPDDPVSFLLIEGPTVFTDSEAAIRVLTDLGGGWRLAVLARIVPPALRDRLYRWIARHRYAWFGRREACLVPPPEFAGRFLP